MDRALEIRGAGTGLLDDPFALSARGAGPEQAVVWRARMRDDDGRVWRAVAERSEDLMTAWQPAKETTGAVSALQSLRPVAIEVRVDAADGRGATRTFTRLMAADGVKVRRWRDGVAATLYRPAEEEPAATVVVDATDRFDVAALAAPLLASRGVLVLVVADGLETALERLAAVPGASESIEVVRGADLVPPPGVGVRDEARGAARARAASWDELLARLGARPR